LEPLPAPTQPWTEVEKIREHNVRAKAQKIRENLKASEKENLQQIEVIDLYIPNYIYLNSYKTSI